MATPSRRAVLKSIGLLGLSGVAASNPVGRALIGPQAEALPPGAFPLRWGRQPYGRITNVYQPGRERPTTQAEEISRVRQDEIVRVRRLVRGETVFSNSDLWLETDQGYFYASFVQPMWPYPPNEPVRDLGEGRYGSVTVPYSETFRQPDTSIGDDFVSRLRYGSVMRVTELVDGEDGQPWYKVQELYQSYYMPAVHLKLIPLESLTPLSPNVDPADKRIEVNLTDQTVIAYEGDTPVYGHHISSGISDYPTSTGRFYVLDKRISERMVGGIDQEKYSFPGVAFVCYFTDTWIATHGCYWHNDWGRPRSHGCVNIPAYAARWFWRWTTPYPEDLNEMVVRPDHKLDGTRVIVQA